MASKWEHLGTKAHELDTVLVVPAQHLDDIPGIGQAQLLDELLASRNIAWLVLVRSVLGGVLWLRGVCEGMTVLYNGGDPAGPRAEDGRDCLPEICIKASLVLKVSTTAIIGLVEAAIFLTACGKKKMYIA